MSSALSAAAFGMTQSRKRVYIMMARKDLCSALTLEAVSAWIQLACPLKGRCHLQDVHNFAQEVGRAQGGDACDYLVMPCVAEDSVSVLP